MPSGNPNIKDHGFSEHPENINRTGANKGSKWKKNMLRDLLTIDLSADELKQFNELKAKFPSIFNSTEEKNFQLFMELKQLSLVFHKNGQIAQNAINAIKDRIDGKPKVTIEGNDNETNVVIVNIPDNGRDKNN